MRKKVNDKNGINIDDYWNQNNELLFECVVVIWIELNVWKQGNSPECIYNLYVQTGSSPSAGTQSNISIFLGDDWNEEFPITKLKDWGLASSTFNYFRQGEVDLFAGKGPCLQGPVCRLIIVLSGFDNWFCDYIEVTVVGFERMCSKKYFTVKKWLDVNKGSAVILQDECPSSNFNKIEWHNWIQLLRTCLW